MNGTHSVNPLKSVVAVAFVAAALIGCGGGDGSQGPTGPQGPAGPPAATTATSLNMTITGVTVNSPPVVNFTVTNQSGAAFTGLTTSNLRFLIAKLTPGSNGDPSTWQNYIVTVQNATAGGAPMTSAVQGTRENNGTLVDHGDGTYTYTFKTDITKVSCPSPCQDASGKTLDLSYQASLTHRVAIATTGSLPAVNATLDFVPAGGAVTVKRDIVDIAKCNECHNKLEAHDARIETKYCVTCHNPGSTDPDTGNTVDFKVMIHKIHRGEGLPSVEAGNDYAIIGFNNTTHSFKDVAFPQDIRNCTKCHDGADANTPQGDNWETHPSMQACGSCHDDVYFGASPDPAKPYQTVAHPGGVVTDNSECLTCHAQNRIAGSIAERHSFPKNMKAEAAKYKLNIVSVTNTSPSQTPTVTFSITNPTNNNAAYDIAATPAITGGSMSLIVGWNTTDMNNSGRSNAQPISVSLLSSGALAGTVTNNGDGTYSVPASAAIPADATGSGRVGFYGRMSVDIDGDGTKDTIQVKSAVKDFPITDATAKARRQVVDIAKCDKCHDQLSLHGGARTDEPQLCVICHNPNATDTARRPAGSPTGTVDNKKEEAIDFKRMIHGIHAGAKTDYSGAAANGFRNKGLVVYGFFTAPATENPVDFSRTRFPGILNDCTTCHTNSSYQLTGLWETPAQNGILGSTIDHGASLTDQTDDLNITPTAAVCSSCHDSSVAEAHMTLNGALFTSPQAAIDTNVEACAVCHGPGRDFDVVTVHAAR